MGQDLMGEIAGDPTLREAWRKIRSNRGESRIDAADLQTFERNLEDNLKRLGEELREERYLPPPLRRVTIPKPSGGTRELAIPTIADRVAQRACVEVLTPIMERVFLPCSFGYRPGRGVADAVRQVTQYRQSGWNWVFDGDVRNFFGSVDHRVLMEQLRTYVPDRAVLRVTGLWLEAGILRTAAPAPRTALSDVSERVTRAYARYRAPEENWEDEEDSPEEAARQRAALTRMGMEAMGLLWAYRREVLPFVTRKALLAAGGAGAVAAGAYQLYRWRQENRAGCADRGTPQGGPLSPLLANLYLHEFDARMTRMGLRLVRYADDFVVCCPSERRARFAESAAQRELARLHLQLHPEKSRVVAGNAPLRFLGHEFDSDGTFPSGGDGD